VTIGIGTIFLIPGIAWFITQKRWDREQPELPGSTRALDEKTAEAS